MRALTTRSTHIMGIREYRAIQQRYPFGKSTLQLHDSSPFAWDAHGGDMVSFLNLELKELVLLNLETMN